MLMMMMLLMMMMILMMTNLARSHIVDPSNPELIFNSLLKARDFLLMIILYGGDDDLLILYWTDFTNNSSVNMNIVITNVSTW